MGGTEGVGNGTVELVTFAALRTLVRIIGALHAHTSAQPEHWVERRLLLDVVVSERATVLELLAGEDQALLVRRNALLVLDLRLDVLDGVVALNFERDRLFFLFIAVGWPSRCTRGWSWQRRWCCGSGGSKCGSQERVRAVEEVKEMYVFASQAIAEGQE